MTGPARTVFAATCSQVFTRWNDEFTFGNDTVTASEPDLRPRRVGADHAARLVAARSALSSLTSTFAGSGSVNLVTHPVLIRLAYPAGRGRAMMVGLKP
jgi:hypothetical protein